MPMTIERQVRALSLDEKDRIARSVEQLKEELQPAKRPRLKFSNFVSDFAVGFVLFFVLWLLTIAASWNAPRGMMWGISVFWILLLAIYSPVLWLMEYREDLKRFRRKQQDFARITEVFNLEMLTALHVRGTDFDCEKNEFSVLSRQDDPIFSPQPGVALVVFEDYSETWILDSNGYLLEPVPN